MNITIRPMAFRDWDKVRRIYFEGIQTGTATFQTTVPSWESWDSGHLSVCRLIAEDGNGCVAGWCALSPISSRPVYRGVAEVSIYIASQFRQRGVGRALMEALVKESEKEGLWTLQAGIFADNIGSIALHHNAGFREVGRRERIGKTESGVWKDTVLMERRSRTVGIE